MKTTYNFNIDINYDDKPNDVADKFASYLQKDYNLEIIDGETLKYQFKKKGNPISVIVPLSDKRINFFESVCLPMIEANKPFEIIIEKEGRNGPVKRNKGLNVASQPYIFFCDDDIVLPKNYLETLYNILENSDDSIAYAYTDYIGIVLNTADNPWKNNFKHTARNWDWIQLKRGNFISTMSLIKREFCVGFDEDLNRFQDWEMWINIYKTHQKKGVYVPNIPFFAYYLDKGVTSASNSHALSESYIRKKHSI